jgi:hypothetical protein
VAKLQSWNKSLSLLNPWQRNMALTGPPLPLLGRSQFQSSDMEFYENRLQNALSDG